LPLPAAGFSGSISPSKQTDLKVAGIRHAIGCGIPVLEPLLTIIDPIMALLTLPPGWALSHDAW
jgi:hypothetical protein